VTAIVREVVTPKTTPVAADRYPIEVGRRGD
jgi:hypothetical protein